jgi:hypothetical protein
MRIEGGSCWSPCCFTFVSLNIEESIVVSGISKQNLDLEIIVVDLSEDVCWKSFATLTHDI